MSPCWALSDISISSGRIPCSALFINIDHLLSRAAEQGVSREIIRKGRNNKIFNGVDTSPLDTLQLALAEAKSWKVAQIIPEAEDDLGQSREAANKHGEGPQSQWVAVTKLMPHGLKQIRWRAWVSFWWRMGSEFWWEWRTAATSHLLFRLRRKPSRGLWRGCWNRDTDQSFLRRTAINLLNWMASHGGSYRRNQDYFDKFFKLLYRLSTAWYESKSRLSREGSSSSSWTPFSPLSWDSSLVGTYGQPFGVI